MTCFRIASYNSSALGQICVDLHSKCAIAAACNNKTLHNKLLQCQGLIFFRKKARLALCCVSFLFHVCAVQCWISYFFLKKKNSQKELPQVLEVC